MTAAALLAALAMAAPVAATTHLSSAPPTRRTILEIRAGEIPIGTVNERIESLTDGTFRIEREGIFRWLAAGRRMTASLNLTQHCHPDGRVETLEYAHVIRDPRGGDTARTVSGSGGVLEVRTKRTSAPLNVERTAVPAGLLGATCVLVAAMRGTPPAVTGAPVLMEEMGIFGSADLEHSPRRDGGRSLTLTVHLESGESVERAEIDAAGRLVSAHSMPANIHARPVAGTGSAFAHVDLMAGAPAPADASRATRLTVRVGKKLRTVKTGRGLKGPDAARIRESFSMTVALLADSDHATCVDYADWLNGALSSWGKARLVTGWVVYDGRWWLHRWVEVRDAAGWVGIDPALGQLAVDATHVPLLRHGDSAADLARVEAVLARARRAPPEVVEMEMDLE